MQRKLLQSKRVLGATLFILLLNAVGMTKMYAYDFSAVCETGQTLYYTITNAECHYVQLTCPNNSYPHYSSWDGYDKPSGNIILPRTVYDENDNQYLVTSIGESAFYWCTELEGELVIPNSVTFIGGYAFSHCIGFTAVTLSNTISNIREYAFNECSGLSGTLSIPNSLNRLGGQAFGSCSGLSGVVNIPVSVTYIGWNPFSGCMGLEQIIVDSNNPYYDSRGNCNAIIETSTNKLISGCKNSVIPNDIVSIEDYAFSGVGLTGFLSLPNGLTSIGRYAFSGCDGLIGTLTIPNTVLLINDCAFSGCSGFVGSLHIPDAVTSVGSSAFSGCSGLTGNLTIPDSVITIGASAFNCCNGFTGSLTIGNSVTTIGERAFYNCNGFMGNLTIGDSVTTIGDFAFYNCSGLSGDLTIPNCVINIGNNVFENCSGFTGDLTIGNSVNMIGWAAFLGCSGLSSIIIGNSVNTISGYAFYGCSGLTSITIPLSVTLIGSYAFCNCSMLSAITMLSATPPTLEYSAFWSTNNTLKIYVPYESQETYKTAANWSNYQSKIRPWLQKSISGYGFSEGGWHFIASPVLSETNPTAIDNMISETEYDLYRFNQSNNTEWENYKDSTNIDDFSIVNKYGYLYANQEDVTLMFKGVFNEFDEQRVSLVYDANASFAGWNLVGNPFPVSAYANKSYYTMNEDGTAIEPVAVSMETAIPACTGVMVKAENTGESVTFSKTAPAGQPANQGVLQIAVAQNNSRSNSVQDKAFVSFNEGDELGKFVFNKDNSKLYIPEGNEDYAIAYAEKQSEMPLNFEAKENGSYTISVNPESVEMTYLHLIDNMTGTDIDLLATPNYSFEAKTSDYASRFRLVFSVNGETDDEDEEPFAIISNGNIFVTGNYADATLQIVNMLGHVVVSTDVSRNISTANLMSGVYVLRLVDGDAVSTQKIVIH